MKGLTLKKHGVFTVMDDNQIINLFFQRDEDAVRAIDEKYGSKLNALVANRHPLINSENRRRTAMLITLLKISGKSMRRAATVRMKAYRL